MHVSRHLPSRSNSRHRPARSRRATAPSVEPLEERTVLSPLMFVGDRRGRLFTLDVATDAVAVRGTMARPMLDLAFSPAGTLFGVDGRGIIYRINPDNGATTRVGASGASLNALVFAPDGTLYGAGGGLYRINTATGLASLVGRFRGLRSAGDLAFDSAGTLYLTTNTNRLARIDPANGAATVVGPIGFRNVFGLGLTPNGVLLGVSDRTQQLLVIDTQTGRGTALGRFGGRGTVGANGAGFVEEAVTPSLTIGDATVTEGDSGLTNAVFTVQLSAPVGRPVTVRFATAPGTATEGVDYLATSGTLQFAPGQTVATIAVPVVGDRLREGNETFAVVLSGPTNATIARGTGVGTIVDDEPRETAGSLQLGADAYSVDEAAGQVLVTVTRTGGAAGTASIRLSTSDGSAEAGKDYEATSVLVTFGPGDSSPRTVAIPIINDRLVEGDESFTITLSDPSTGVVPGSPSTAVVTIRDDDSYVQLGADAYTVDEAAGQALVTVTRTGGAAGTASIRLSTSDGSAEAGLDYVATSVVVTFGPGDAIPRAVAIPLLLDQIVGGDEYFTITLSDPSAGAIPGSPGMATVTIRDIVITG